LDFNFRSEKLHGTHRPDGAQSHSIAIKLNAIGIQQRRHNRIAGSVVSENHVQVRNRDFGCVDASVAHVDINRRVVSMQTLRSHDVRPFDPKPGPQFVKSSIRLQIYEARGSVNSAVRSKNIG
jgi:hypothetical protein